MNKQIFALLLFMSISFFGFTQKKDVTIKGKIDVKNVPSVILCSTAEGDWVRLDTAKVADDGTFSFTVNMPQRGIWGIVSSVKERYTRPYYIKFYLTQNQDIDITVGEQWNEYTFNGILTKENKLLQKWNSIYGQMFGAAHQTYKDLYPKVDAFIQSGENLKKEFKKLDKNDEIFFTNMVNYDMAYGMMLFRYSPNTIHPSDNEVHPIYAKILNNEKFENEFLLNYPLGKDYIRMVTMGQSMPVMKSNKEKGISLSSLDITMPMITSDKLKALQFINNIDGYRTYEDFAVDYDKYKNLLWSENQKKVVNQYIAEKKRYVRGEPAFNFTYPDMNGKMVSLSDFKGKVVLVDVWATWCGPCKQQIPYLKKLEEELHGKDIVFIGVSVDTQDKKQAWIDMVKEEGLKGVQLFAGGFSGSKICEDYKITGIPRFMIFDKDGKIYSVNAPRPSEPELKTILLNLSK